MYVDNTFIINLIIDVCAIFFLPRVPGHDIRSSVFSLVKVVFPVNSIITTVVTISVLLIF